MAEVVLLGPKIGALVGQIVSATVAQHVRPHSAQLGVLAGDPTDVIDRLPGELGVAFGDEQPRQAVLTGGEIALDGTQLVAGDRLLDASRHVLHCGTVNG